MPTPLKKRDPYKYADRFYDYIMAHKGEVLRYITAALVTALVQYFLKRFFVATEYGVLVPFTVRFILLFYALKYWAYREGGTGAFYTGRQLMLAIMIITVGTMIFNYITIFLVGLLGRPVLINYILQALVEIFYFVVYQFFIFKEPKND